MHGAYEAACSTAGTYIADAAWAGQVEQYGLEYRSSDLLCAIDQRCQRKSSA